MEFKTNDNPWIRGYPIHESYSLIELNAFHLLSIVNASFHSNAIDDLKEVLVKEYERSEVSRILIELAVQIRNKLDLNDSIYEGFKYNPTTVTGELEIKRTDGTINNIDLTFREACNKIIHAKHINFDLLNAKSIKDYDHMNSVIYLYGDLKSCDWKAKLEIVKFISILINIK